jgi:hypothetical protein
MEVVEVKVAMIKVAMPKVLLAAADSTAIWTSVRIIRA